MLDGLKRAEKTNRNESNEIKLIRTKLINEINNFRKKIIYVIEKEKLLKKK